MSEQKAVKDWMDFYADETVAETLQPDEITVGILIEKVRAKGQDTSWKKAARKLDEDVKAGKLTMRMVIHNGHWCKAYKKAA